MHCASAGRRRRATLAYEQIRRHVIHKTGSTQHIITPPERTEPRPQATCTKKIGEDRMCSSEDMIADRQTHTHRQTDRQTDTLITILRSDQGRINQWAHWARVQAPVFFLFEGPPTGCGERIFLTIILLLMLLHDRINTSKIDLQ